MDVLRNGFEGFYNLIKPLIFGVTKNNPKIAHGLFVKSLRGLQALSLDDLVLDNSSNYIELDYVISNAAGFVKNAEIDPRVMKLLGFDRVVVGTVTYGARVGNGKHGQTIWRFPKTGSMVNWDGWSNVGMVKVLNRLERYGDHGVSLTINLGLDPDEDYGVALRNYKEMVRNFRDVPKVDRFEFNGSCPNVKSCGRPEDVLEVLVDNIYPWQSLYWKVSPDLDEGEVDDIVAIGEKYGVDGYVVSNTTVKHDSRYITERLDRGSASGDAVWDASVRVQEYFAERTDKRLVACGGINSVKRARYRCGIGDCGEVQVFVPVALEGPGFLKDLRKG